jgi:hypothetical protein
MYLERTQFTFHYENWLPWLRFLIIFLSSSRQRPGNMRWWPLLPWAFLIKHTWTPHFIQTNVKVSWLAALISIWKVLNSNLSQKTAILNKVFMGFLSTTSVSYLGSLWLELRPGGCGFLQLLKENVTSNRTLPYPAKSFPCHHSQLPYHLKLYNLCRQKSVVK